MTLKKPQIYLPRWSGVQECPRTLLSLCVIRMYMYS
jgi:hypothetical protein